MNSKNISKPLLTKFEKKVITENEQLYFEFYGKPSEKDIDKEKLNTIIDNIFDTRCFNNNIEAVICYIRTILKKYNEKYLSVELKVFGTNQYKKIVIEDKKISEYKKTMLLKISNSEKLLITIDCNTNIGLSISIPNQPNSIDTLDTLDFIINFHLHHLTINNITSSTFRTMKEINEMNLLSNLYFNKEEKNLIDIYQMFFAENPNFSDERVVFRTQAMMAILWEYNISLPNELGFHINDQEECPHLHSDNIQTVINYLAPFGEIKAYGGDQIAFNYKVNIMIIELGKIINEFCNYYCDNFEEKDSLLQNISIITHIIKNKLPKTIKIDDIITSKYVYCDSDLTKNIIGLLSVIEEIIKKFNDNKQLTQYKRLYTTCSQYPESDLPSYENRLKFNIETDYKKIVEGGFIEKFCLSKQEQKKLQLLRKQNNVNNKSN